MPRPARPERADLPEAQAAAAASSARSGGRGERLATGDLMTQVYDDLRRLADRYLARERRGYTLQPTALVHEAYLRLAGAGHDWENRAHFFGAAARAIRRILLDRARARNCERRGSAHARLSIEVVGEIAVGGPRLDFLVLDEALERLACLDPQKARVVELRFFGGLDVEETARVLGTSASSVARDWRFARAWLHRELAGPDGEP